MGRGGVGRGRGRQNEHVQDATELSTGPKYKSNKCSPTKVKSCLRTFLAHLFSHIGLCILIVGYAIIGAALFERLESGYELEQRDSKYRNWTSTFRKIRLQYVNELWNITEQFNVLYEMNWTSAVELELRKFESIVAAAAKRDGYDGSSRETDMQWSFSGALLYSVSIITTIGYGNTAPRTASGKILTMFYAVIGVPLMLLWLSNIGTLMANTFKFAYSHACCPPSTHKSVHTKHRPPPPHHHPPSSIQVKYSVSAKTCETYVVQDEAFPPPPGPYQNHPPPPPNGRMRRGEPPPAAPQRMGLRQLDAAAKQVLRECAEYNVQSDHDEGSLRVLHQLGRPAAEDDDNNSDEVESAGECRGSRSPSYFPPLPSDNCNSLRVNNGGGGGGAAPSPSKVPLLTRGACGGEGGPDLVEVLEEPYREERGVSHPPHRPLSEQRVPISLVLVFVVFYIMGGAIVFSIWEEWNFLESAYFCFITLSTIGLGDYVPGRSLKSAGTEEGHAQLIVCCLYLVLGLAIIAMSFNLVQEEVAAKVKDIARHIGIIKDNSHH